MKGHWSLDIKMSDFDTEMIKNNHAKKGITWYGNSLLMGLGQDQHQNRAVHTGAVSKGRVRGFGCWP